MAIYRNPETDEEISCRYTEEEARIKWENIADGYNKWHTLDLDEKLDLMQVIK